MKSTRHKPATAERNQLRIIAGKWRSRRIAFPDVDGLRPTGDRIRETLFNWLGPRIADSRCLDAFAGSGALGFEALSRGAEEVVMIENNPVACRQLEASRQLFGAAGATLLCCDTNTWLASAANERAFDIVFLDPPFNSDLLNRTISLITGGDLVSPEGLIYLETAVDTMVPVPQGWAVWREKITGGVHCRLLART